MIQPTIFGRSSSLDVIRGFAIFGILAANIVAFGTPAMSNAIAFVAESDADRIVEALRISFVSGKFRSTLAILFGIGIWLQYRKRLAVDGNWPGGYLKRTFYLGLFGLLHFILIWWGDILFSYALVAMAACLMAHLADRVLKLVIAGLVVVSLCVGAVLALLFAFIPDEIAGADIFDVQREIAVHTTGGYFDQVLFRLEMLLFVLPNAFLLVPPLLAIFLLGILFARSGVVAAPSEHPRIRNATLAICLGLGLPLNLLALLAIPYGGWIQFQMMAEFVTGPLLAPGYLMVVAIAVERRWFTGLQRALAQVGRVALTSYILQSVICTALFYSWGFGLYERLSALEMLAVVPLVWLVNIAFAYAWLSRFSIGPLEWALRSVTEGRALPWKYERPPEPEPVVEPEPRPEFQL
jgi:uncharacterized protein